MVNSRYLYRYTGFVNAGVVVMSIVIVTEEEISFLIKDFMGYDGVHGADINMPYIFSRLFCRLLLHTLQLVSHLF